MVEEKDLPLVLQRKVENGKHKNWSIASCRMVFWMQICTNSYDFQSKIGANSSDSHPILPIGVLSHMAFAAGVRLAQLGIFTRNLAL